MTAIQATGARITGKFQPPANAGGQTPNAIEFLVTGFSMSIEDRPQIEVTRGTDSIVRMVPGKRGNTTVTINARFDQTSVAQLNLQLKECGPGDLLIHASRMPESAATDCDIVAVVGTGQGDEEGDLSAFEAYLMGYSVEAAMDTAVDATLNFMLHSTGTAIGQPS